MKANGPPVARASSFAEDMNVRLDAVERLMKLFRLERLVYLAATSVSVAMLLISAGFVIATRKATNVELVGFFGSSGLITFSAGRLLLMWNQALSLLAAGQKGVQP
jgi:uncharacterized Tic20 family protein